MNCLDNVMIVGLTGQTGAGKTTVCKVFEENGFSIINADKVSRDVTVKGSPCLKELCLFFGRDILLDDGSLNRRMLGNIVFSDKKKLEILNSVVYPYITSEILAETKRLSATGHKLILLDAPTLFESRTDDFCELIISVVSHENLRLERIIKRDSISREHAKNRINSQLKEEYFRNNSDFIIKNNYDKENLFAVAKEVSDKVKEYYNRRRCPPPISWRTSLDSARDTMSN